MGSGRGRRGAVREGYKVVALLLKPSLGLFGLVGRRRVLLHPGSATGHLIAPGDHHTLQHIQVHFGVDIQADFEDVRWHNVALTCNHTKDHNRSRKLCFHHPRHVPLIRGNLDLHFEGAGNGPVVITWIGRENELYSVASPISLVEHCVTFRHDHIYPTPLLGQDMTQGQFLSGVWQVWIQSFPSPRLVASPRLKNLVCPTILPITHFRHDRRLLSLLRFIHNWPTSRWSATTKENRFSLNGNVIMSSFLWRQFYRSTIHIYIYIYIYVCVCVCVCVCVYVYSLLR